MNIGGLGSSCTAHLLYYFSVAKLHLSVILLKEYKILSILDFQGKLVLSNFE